MKIEHYSKATTLQEAYDLLQSHESNAIMGGGAWMKLTNKSIDTLIDISGLGLDTITETNEVVRIGAMTTLRELETNPIVQQLDSGILSKAAGTIMGINVRNLATIGGSVMGKYSFSDVITALLAMDATLIFHQRAQLSLSEYLQLRHPEPDILVAIELPKTASKGYFNNVKKTAMDFAVLSIAIVRHDEIAIAIGARPGVAVLAHNTMATINSSKPIDETIIPKIAQLVAEEVSVSSNLRASGDYRKELVQVYVRRGLQEVLS